MFFIYLFVSKGNVLYSCWKHPEKYVYYKLKLMHRIDVTWYQILIHEKVLISRMFIFVV